MNLDELMKESKKRAEEAVEKAQEWTERLPLDPSSENQNSGKNKNRSILQQMEQWVSQTLDSVQDLFPDTSEFTKGLQQKFMDQWELWQEILRDRERYLPVLPIIFRQVARYRKFKKQIENMTEEEQQAKADSFHKKNAQEIVKLCKKQGGAWIKAAQFISCRSDWLPQVYSDILASLQDQAPPASWEAIEQVLNQSLGAQWSQQFESLDHDPIATASIGQVHKGQLRYGPVVALKVQLPKVDQKIKADLRFFQALATLLNDQFEGFDLEQIVKELSKSIVSELDYYNEAGNLTQFFTQYHTQRWDYPILVQDLLTPTTLGMYFIEGKPIRQFLKEVPSAADAVLKELVRSFLKQIFKNRLFHADPHPGNFFVTAQGKIALLDFGAVGRLSEQQAEAYRNVVVALVTEQTDSIDELLADAGFKSPHPEKLRRLLAKERPPEYQGLGRLQYYMEVLRQAKVKMPDNFVLMARVIIVLGGLLKQHNVSLSMMELAQYMMDDS